MPGRRDLQIEVSGRGADVIRKERLAELAAHTGRDTILYAAGLGTKLVGVPPLLVSINSNDIQGLMTALRGLKGEKLDLIIVSGGGSAETAEQIVNYLRAKYKSIRAIIPQNAMSAATMIACACDSILMGKQSAIGPIDPQMIIQTPAGPTSMPARQILDEFELAKSEILANPRVAPLWVTKIQNLPPGFLANCTTASNRSIALVEDWLHRYMKLPQAKAASIASWLGDADEHKSHGRPICAAQAEEAGLKIEFLENNQALQDKVLDVFHAAMLSLLMTNCVKIIENHNGQGEYSQVQVMFAPGMPGMAAPGASPFQPAGRPQGMPPGFPVPKPSAVMPVAPPPSAPLVPPEPPPTPQSL